MQAFQVRLVAIRNETTAEPSWKAWNKAKLWMRQCLSLAVLSTLLSTLLQSELDATAWTLGFCNAVNLPIALFHAITPDIMHPQNYSTLLYKADTELMS